METAVAAVSVDEVNFVPEMAQSRHGLIGGES